MPKKKNLFILLFCLLPVLIINADVHNTHIGFQVTNFIIVIWSLYKLFPFSSSTKMDTNALVYLFIYMFVGIAPLYQYANNVSIWGGLPLSGDDYFYTNVFFIIALFFYDIFYYIFSRNNKILKNSKERISKYNKLLPLTLAVFSTLFTLYAFRSYPILLLFREFQDEGKITFNTFSNTSLNLLYTIVIRPIPVIILTLYNIIYRRFDKYFYILLLLILITNFPLSLPRFYVAGLYFPLLCSIFPNLLRRDILLKGLFLFGILYVFPFLNQGRTVTDFSDIKFSFSINYDMFLEGHFDSFQNFARVIVNNTVTYGRQLFGVLIFWLPRSIYPNKPIGSGGYIADEYNLDFDHISLNYWGEGWINFGMLGVPVFSIILAYINSKFDKIYWKTHCTPYMFTIYCLYLGLTFFILRGDLISCFAYTVGLFISAYICYKSFVIK